MAILRSSALLLVLCSLGVRADDDCKDGVQLGSKHYVKENLAPGSLFDQVEASWKTDNIFVKISPFTMGQFFVKVLKDGQPEQEIDIAGTPVKLAMDQQNDILYISTSKEGIFSYNGLQKSATKFLDFNPYLFSISDNGKSVIYTEPGEKGIKKLDTTTKTTSLIKGIVDGYISSFTTDAKGNIIYYSDGTVYFSTPESDSQKVADTLHHLEPIFFTTKSNDVLYVLGSGDLFKINIDAKSAEYIGNINIESPRAIAEDYHGNLIVGAPYQLYKLRLTNSNNC